MDIANVGLRALGGAAREIGRGIADMGQVAVIGIRAGSGEEAARSIVREAWTHAKARPLQLAGTTAASMVAGIRADVAAGRTAEAVGRGAGLAVTTVLTGWDGGVTQALLRAARVAQDKASASQVLQLTHVPNPPASVDQAALGSALVLAGKLLTRT